MTSRAGAGITAVAAGSFLAALCLAAFPAAADDLQYRLHDGNRRVFGGPTGVQIYRPPPYRPPIYQPRKPDLDPEWRAAPGLNPLKRPRRDLRPWRPR